MIKCRRRGGIYKVLGHYACNMPLKRLRALKCQVAFELMTIQNVFKQELQNDKHPTTRRTATPNLANRQ